METVYRTCAFCEAACGLEVKLDAEGGIESIRGDSDDVSSHGYLCPKGVSLKALHEDPDRVRTPLRRQPDGSFAPISWDAAFAEIDARFNRIIDEHGRDAIGLYLGNPSTYNLSGLLYGWRGLGNVIGTKNRYSALTLDTMPKHVAVGLMFGAPYAVSVPDIDRTQHMLILGANPVTSNGSAWSVANVRGRLRAMQERGGKLVVVDPRRSRTAEEADEHHFIRPGTDALLLFALVQVLLEEGLADPGEHLVPLVSGLEALPELATDFTPEAVAPACGLQPGEIRRMARELAAAERAVVYGRIGTCTQEFGTHASWLVEVLNVLTGNLDREGGAMYPLPAADYVIKGRKGRGVPIGRYASRVRGAPEIMGEFPAACIAEEISTPGLGRMRGLITIAGNPVLSIPDGGSMEEALGELDFMLALDIYVNETTRHADLILPGPSPLARSHYPLPLYKMSVRNLANYSPASVEPDPGTRQEWTTLLRLWGVFEGRGPDSDIEELDGMVAFDVARRALAQEDSPLHGRDPAEIVAAADPHRGPDRLLDIMLRSGPYELTLDELLATPHGIDLGPMRPRLADVVNTESGKVDLVPERIAADVPRLRAALARVSSDGVTLIGRRQLRSNNSWMHNLQMLVRGPVRCTLHVHPDTASACGLEDGGMARVSSPLAAVEVPVEVTDAIMPGVVSIPHGWGHGAPNSRLEVANDNAGVNCNLLIDTQALEPLSGTSILNGAPVELSPAEVP